MSLMETLRQWLGQSELAEDARRTLGGAARPAELLAMMEDLRASNAVALRRQLGELTAVEAELARATGLVRAGGQLPAEETATLVDIERAEARRATVEKLVAIHHHNVRLLEALLGRVQEANALALRRVDDQAIDDLADTLETRLLENRRVTLAAEAALRVTGVDQTDERRRLDALKQRIVGSPDRTRHADRDADGLECLE